MSETLVIEKLKSQGTWRLLGLGLITYGVYYAYYAKRQTVLINSHLNNDSAISLNFINAIFIMSYLSLALFIPYLFIDEDRTISILLNVADRIWLILFIVWGFMVRNRMNRLLSLSSDDEGWFHGFWTFLFSPLYFNYKVNTLNDKNAEQ